MAGQKLTVDQLEVIISATNEELTNVIREVQTDLNKLEKKATKTTTKLGAVFKKVAAVIASVGLGNVIKKSLQTGMDAVETASLFTTTLGSEMATKVNDWSMEVAAALGLSNTNIQRNVGVIYNIAMAMGVAENNSIKMAKGISILAEDMASFYNLDPGEMFNKLRSGLIGVYKPLQDLGIRLDEETIKQVAYKKGIAAVGAELNNEQLILARYEAILERTSAAQGDLGRTLESPANQFRIFKNHVHELWLALSRFLLPAFSYLMTILNQVTLAIIRTINTFANFLRLNTTNAIEKGIESPVKRVSTGISNADKAAKKLKGTLAGFDEMNVLEEPSTGFGAGKVAGGFSDYQLDEYLVNMGEQTEKAKAFGEKIGLTIETIGTSITKVVSVIATNWEIIGPILMAITTTLFVWKGYFAALNLIPVIYKLGGSISRLWTLITHNPIVATIAVIGGLIAAFVTAYNTNEEFRKKVDETFGKIKETISNTAEKIKTKFEEVKTKVTNVGTKIREAFGSAGEIFKGFKEGLEETFKRIVNSVIKGINKVLSWPLNKINSMLNKIRSINIFGFKPFEKSWGYNPISIPQIPLLERGGVLKKGQIGLLEGKGAEAVVPLEKNTEWIDRIAEKLNSNTGQPIQLIVKIGESTILDKIIDGINEKEFRTGKAVLNV